MGIIDCDWMCDNTWGHLQSSGRASECRGMCTHAPEAVIRGLNMRTHVGMPRDVSTDPYKCLLTLIT